MPDLGKLDGQSVTICLELPDFVFHTLDAAEGKATIIRFQVTDRPVRSGDVLLVLNGGEISFHGMISTIENGWAVAADRSGSSLPAVSS